MKSLLTFVKTTLIGGLLVVLPVCLLVVLLMKAINAALEALRPIASLLPQTVAHENLMAVVLLVVGCFLVGLVTRTPIGGRFGIWVETNLLSPIPGYTFLRGLTRQFTGHKDEELFQPALAEIEDALVPAFIVERHADGQLTIFVSSSPTPMAGAIYILPPERVHPVNVPLPKAMACVTRWGVGARDLRAAIRPTQK